MEMGKEFTDTQKASLHMIEWMYVVSAKQSEAVTAKERINPRSINKDLYLWGEE